MKRQLLTPLLLITAIIAVAYFGFSYMSKDNTPEADNHSINIADDVSKNISKSIIDSREKHELTNDNDSLQIDSLTSTSKMMTTDTFVEAKKVSTPPIRKRKRRKKGSKKVKNSNSKGDKTPAVIPLKPTEITFEKMLHEFGEIEEGDIVKYDFKFTNTGKYPLEIIGATASCGCTSPSIPFITIAPGESNVVGVKYSSVNKEGDQTPEITIEANTIPKFTTLKLNGIVKSKEKENADSTSTPELPNEKLPSDTSKIDTPKDSPKKIIKDSKTKIGLSKDTIK